MANRPAPGLLLREGDRGELEALVRSRSARAGLVRRARIVLLAADGLSNTEIARRVGASRTTVIAWRGRYQRLGMEGLEDADRPGRPRKVDHTAIVTATLTPPPRSLGVTHWSTRLLAARLGVSAATVARAWRAYGIKPWREQSFRFSTDPEPVGKVTDICGLYLGTNPDVPDNAIVLCVDEKSQIQALDRTMPVLPMQPGLIERRSSDYVRHGTTTLFAALEIATGKVTAATRPRHRHEEFLAFLRQVDRAYKDAIDPDTGERVQLHLVMDNYATHKHKDVRAWLEHHPHIHVHHTPTHASWMNLVEVWFSLIERQAIRRGVFKSVQDLNNKLRAYITGWNKRAHPFTWTKTAEQILTKANRPEINNPGH
ncbi:IS630 family transposase [Actinomyces respiraculi]|uniref:IS630 family transposase n=1 Tax=Actinomyces respiraculi TaxID=2744574 RepID=A0A7T0LLP3_9ACTO|nr:IS630 family transposase [Actinomyces respiraculi]QPL05653.1 IS630 family transposase [Actinomyces respiraculi]